MKTIDQPCLDTVRGGLIAFRKAYQEGAYNAVRYMAPYHRSLTRHYNRLERFFYDLGTVGLRF